MREFEVVNVKLSIKLQGLEYDNIIKLSDDSKINVSPNFTVLFKKFTYTIFRPNSKNGVVHCNITKVRSLSKISEAINYPFQFYQFIYCHQIIPFRFVFPSFTTKD